MEGSNTQKVSHARFLSLVYHDLFQYPLTREELWFWQIGKGEEPLHRASYTPPFFHLTPDKTQVFQRIAKTRESTKKWQIAERAAKVLAKIPSIKMVGASGSLAMGNAGGKDDIDLAIFCAVDTLWISRLLAYILFKFAKIPVRRFSDQSVKDKICLNLWLDEGDLKIRRREIYTAHEVAQLKVIVNKDRVYQKFLFENRWAAEFFPNAFFCLEKVAEERGSKYSVFSKLASTFLRLLNKPAFAFQKRHMRGKKTKEVVEAGRALFHPDGLEDRIPQLFLVRLEHLSKKPTAFSKNTHLTD